MVFLFEIMHAVGKVCSNWVGLKVVRSLLLAAWSRAFPQGALLLILVFYPCLSEED